MRLTPRHSVLRPLSCRLSAAVLLFVGACGGGGDSPGTPSGPITPTPPASLTPATVSVAAGASQTGEPNTALGIRPEVVVRSASGAVVPGITVTFRVDSGGGAVEASSVTTNSSGVASAGAWRLGPEEGRNVLVASVANIAPVSIVATAGVTVRVVSDTTFSTGTLRVGSGPLAGATIEVPSGAFSTTARWTLEQRSVADWPRERMVHPIGTALRVKRADPSLAGAPMVLTLPIAVPSGSRPIVLLRDPATGNLMAIPSVVLAPGVVTAYTTHFNGAQLEDRTVATGSAGSTSISRMMVAPSDFVDVAVSSVPASELDGDVDTGYRPDADQFGFEPLQTVLDGGNDVALGMVTAELVYFARKKPALGALWRRFEEAPGVRYSNRRAMRAIGLSTGDGTLNFVVLGAILRGIRNAVRPERIGETFHDVLKANLVVTKKPQLVVGLTNGAEGVVFVAYKTVGGQIFLSHPDKPGDATLSVTYAGGSFGTLHDPASGASFTEVSAASVGSFITPRTANDIAGAFDDQWPAGAERFPETAIKARTAFLDDTILYVVDTGRVWVECATCKKGMMSNLTSQKVEGFGLFGEAEPGQWTNFVSGTDNGIKWAITEESYNARIGTLVLQSATPGGEVEWLDWRWFRAKRWKLALTPGQVATVGSPVTITATLEGSTPPAHRFVFRIGSGASMVTAQSATPSVTVTLAQSGPQPVEVEMQRTSDGKVIALGKGTLNAYAIFPTWRVTAMTVTTETGGPAPWGDGTGIQSSWNYWTTFTNGIRDQVRQGALLYIPRDTSFGGSLKPRGLYLVDGTPINVETLATQLDILGVGSFPGIRPPGRLRGAWLVSQLSTYRAADLPALSELYSESGTLSGGSIAGRYWEWQTAVNRNGVITNYPPFVREANVTFSGDTVTGTLTFIARENRSDAMPAYSETARWTIRVTFSGVRVK